VKIFQGNIGLLRNEGCIMVKIRIIAFATVVEDDVPRSITVKELKKRIADKFGRDPDDLFIGYQNKIWEDSATLEEMGVQDYDKIYVTVRAPFGSSSQNSEKDFTEEPSMNLEAFLVEFFSRKIVDKDPIILISQEIKKRSKDGSLERMYQILSGIQSGMTSKEIAQKIGLKPVSVRTFIHSLKEKLGFPITIKKGNKFSLSFIGKILFRAIQLKLKKEPTEMPSLEEIFGTDQEG